MSRPYSPPFTANQINIAESSVIPSTVNLCDNTLYFYYARYLFQRMISVFKFEIPPYWNKDYFLNVLYSTGYLLIFEHEKFGVIPQYCSFTEYGLFLTPKKARVDNAFLSFEGQINKDCVLLKLTNDYAGLLDIVHFYASKMALCSQSIDINLVNSKVATVFHVGNKAVAEAMKKMYDEINSGKPAVVIDSKYKEQGAMWECFNRSIKESFIVPELESELRKLEEDFYATIGLPNYNKEKKERLSVDEVNKGDTVTQSLCELWLENLRDGIERAKKMFPSLKNLSVDWRIENG